MKREPYKVRTAKVTKCSNKERLVKKKRLAVEKFWSFYGLTVN